MLTGVCKRKRGTGSAAKAKDGANLALSLLRIDDDIPVVPCVATDRESVKQVMLALLDEVKRSLQDDDVGV